MADKQHNGTHIIDHCKELVSLARSERWGDFEKKLLERDAAIESFYNNVYVTNLTDSDRNDLDTIKRLNDDIKSVVLEKQKIIRDSLLVDTQRSKAHRAYRQR